MMEAETTTTEPAAAAGKSAVQRLVINHLLPSNMRLLADDPPTKHGTQMLLMMEGDHSPRLARWSDDGGYVVQGWIGVQQPKPRDLWIDVSGLMRDSG